MKVLIKLTSIMVIVALSTSCSILMPAKQQLHITAHPPDAVIIVNGQRFHKSPAVVDVKRNRSVNIQAHKDGYHSSSKMVGNHFNGVAALDVIGALIWLFPGIGLFTPGARSLDDTEIHMQLHKKDGEKSTEPTKAIN